MDDCKPQERVNKYLRKVKSAKEEHEKPSSSAPPRVDTAAVGRMVGPHLNEPKKRKREGEGDQPAGNDDTPTDPLNEMMDVSQAHLGNKPEPS